jgi:hypothetical protein
MMGGTAARQRSRARAVRAITDLIISYRRGRWRMASAKEARHRFYLWADSCVAPAQHLDGGALPVRTESTDDQAGTYLPEGAVTRDSGPLI